MNTNQGKENNVPHISLAHLFLRRWELDFGVTDASLFTPFLPGRWPHNAAHPLDAPREHHVQKIHHGKWRLEPGGRVVGDLHIRQTALVPAVQQWGTWWAGRDPQKGEHQEVSLDQKLGHDHVWLCWEQQMAC